MQINITDFTQKWSEGEINERVINYRYITHTQILYKQLYYSNKEMKEEENNNEQRKSFEKSILSEVPKELPLFSLHGTNEAFNSLYRDESQKQREAESGHRPIILTKIQYEEYSDEVDEDQDEESVGQSGSSNLNENINSIHAKNWKKLKMLTRILVKLLHQKGQIEVDSLKGLLVDKFQSLFGPLSEKTKTNIGRRYYDAKSILENTYYININNDKISLVNNIQENQKQIVQTSKKEFVESERSFQLKKQRAKLLQKSLKTLNNLISRNKKTQEKKVQKMQMPLVTYLMDQNEPLASHFKVFNNKKVKAEGKNMQFLDDFELLDYMSQDLMQRPVRNRRT